MASATNSEYIYILFVSHASFNSNFLSFQCSHTHKEEEKKTELNSFRSFHSLNELALHSEVRAINSKVSLVRIDSNRSIRLAAFSGK